MREEVLWYNFELEKKINLKINLKIKEALK